MEGQLFEAVFSNSLSSVQECLEFGYHVNSQNSEGDTPLHVAVRKKGADVVEYLLAVGANVNSINKEKKTPFKVYLEGRGDASIAKLLIENGADINTRRKGDGYTLLHCAVQRDDIELVRYLLDEGKGTDVNVPGHRMGFTPLHLAAKHQSHRPETFELLFKAGAYIMKFDLDGYSAFHLLLMEQGMDFGSIRDIVELFAKYEYDFERRAKDGMLPIDAALEQFKHPGAVNLVKALVEVAGVDVNALTRVHRRFYEKEPDPSGLTILHEACQNRNLPLVKYLLRSGANVNVVDSHKMSPLLYAMRASSEESDLPLIEFLLENGADVNLITSEGVHVLNLDPDLFDPNYYEVLRETIMDHVLKLRATGQSLHPTLLKIIVRESQTKNYFKK